MCADLLKGMDVCGGQSGEGEGGGQRRQGAFRCRQRACRAPEKEKVEGESCSALVPTGRGLTSSPPLCQSWLRELTGSGASVQTLRGSREML